MNVSQEANSFSGRFMMKRNIFEVLIAYFCCGMKKIFSKNPDYYYNCKLSKHHFIVTKMLFKNSRLSFRLCQLQLKTSKMSNSADPTFIRALISPNEH